MPRILQNEKNVKGTEFAQESYKYGVPTRNTVLVNIVFLEALIA